MAGAQDPYQTLVQYRVGDMYAPHLAPDSQDVKA
jgi:hypothetical protein